MSTPLPSNISFGIIRGRFGTSALVVGDTDGTPDFIPLAGLIVTFTASVEALLDRSAEPNPVTILMDPVICSVDPLTGYLLGVDGVEGVRLIATDDPDLDPHGDWTYNITYGGVAASRKLKASTTTVPSGSDRWITNISPVPSSTGVSLTQAQAAQDAATLAASQAMGFADEAEASAVLAAQSASDSGNTQFFEDPTHPGLYAIPLGSTITADPAPGHTGLYLMGV